MVIKEPVVGTSYTITVKAAFVFFPSGPQHYSLVVLCDLDGHIDSPYNPALKMNGTAHHNTSKPEGHDGNVTDGESAGQGQNHLAPKPTRKLLLDATNAEQTDAASGGEEGVAEAERSWSSAAGGRLQSLGRWFRKLMGV